jgi:hypothetical protein
MCRLDEIHLSMAVLPRRFLILLNTTVEIVVDEVDEEAGIYLILVLSSDHSPKLVTLLRHRMQIQDLYPSRRRNGKHI